MSETSRYAEVVQEITARSCQELFSEYGCVVRTLGASEVDSTALALYGSLGFFGRSLHGRVLIGCSRDLLEASNPSKQVPVREWIGELTNQLLGRIKNRWLLHGVEIQVGSPLALSDPRTAEAQTRNLPSVRLRGSAGIVARVSLDLSFGRGFQMSERPDPNLAGAKESDSLLF